jgi:putative DNA primase/helicase
MSAAESIARALGGRKEGSQWKACCPAHEDSNPSLAIRDDRGKLLFHCHAGCAQDAVIEALKERGLWESEPREQPRRVVAEYSYTDERGDVLYQVVRTDPKGFFQRYPDGHGGWINKKNKRQVLYRLPEVLEAPIVFVVEGEKDAESLRAHGFVATTNAGGATAPWLTSFTETLRGREVILIPDNDNPGRQRVLTIARALLGHAAQIIVLALEDGKDVSEWFERGHSELELISQVQGQEVNR